MMRATMRRIADALGNLTRAAVVPLSPLRVLFLSLKWETRNGILLGLGCFIVSLTWYLMMFCSVPTADAARWVKNELTFSIAHLTIFPAAYALIASMLTKARILKMLSSWPSRILLVLIVIAVLIVAWDDFWNRTVEPYQLSTDAPQAFSLEMQLRKQYDNGNVNEELEKHYLSLIEGFSDPSSAPLFARSNGVSFVKLFLNVFYGILMGLFAWTLINFCRYRKQKLFKLTKSECSMLLKITFLFVLWIPMRVYANWYQHYFTPYLTQSSFGPALLPICVVILISVVVLVNLIPDTGRLKKVFKWIMSVSAPGAIAGVLIHSREAIKKDLDERGVAGYLEIIICAWVLIIFLIWVVDIRLKDE